MTLFNVHVERAGFADALMNFLSGAYHEFRTEAKA